MLSELRHQHSNWRDKMNLYAITLADNTIRFVRGKGRQSACMKLTGMRVKAAMEAGRILAIVKASGESA